MDDNFGLHKVYTYRFWCIANSPNAKRAMVPTDHACVKRQSQENTESTHLALADHDR